MRHRVDKKKLGKTASHRKAMFRNMVTSLIEEERLETTLAKAKELRRVADKMVTLGKNGSLHARRQALSYVRNEQAVTKLFSEITDRFRERPGGYTRVLKLGERRGDGAPMAMIEYLDTPLVKVKSSSEDAKSAKPAKSTKPAKSAAKKESSAEPKAKGTKKKEGVLSRVLGKKSKKS